MGENDIKRRCLILLAHGSRDPRWRRPFDQLIGALQEDLGRSAVRLAYMEIGEPTLMRSCGDAAAEEIKHIRVLPLFMGGGGHVERDIPLLIKEVREKYPNMSVELLNAVGEHPLFAGLIRKIAKETA